MNSAVLLQNDTPQSGVLSGPFDVAPSPEGIRLTPATVELVQGQVQALLSAEERDDKQMEAAVSRLSLEPAVTSVRWQVESPDEDD